MILRYQFNYGWKDLLNPPTPGTQVGVFRRSGSLAYLPFWGIVDIDLARAWPGAQSVKLLVNAYTLENIPCHWVYLSKGQGVQGCLLITPGYRQCMIYGVTERGAPRVVPTPAHKEST